MSPSGRDRRRKASKSSASEATPNGVSGTASKDWALAMYMTADGGVPSRDFLMACPPPVRQMLLAIVVAVRDSPPPSFPKPARCGMR